MKSVKVMLYRKIGTYIEDHFKADTDKILILEGARQIGKSNERQVKQVGKITYLPIYYVMFIDATGADNEDIYF